ncbi:hypothetical protein IWW37_006112, partial [Coemansia sp. RSA 2050]
VVSGGNVQATPQSRPGADEYHEHKLEIRLRREKLATALSGLGKSLRFDSLVAKIGLSREFGDYEAKTMDLFIETVDQVPAVLLRGVGVAPLESDYVRCFMEMFYALDLALSKSTLAAMYFKVAYQIIDRQAVPVYKSTLKPDLVFAFASSDTAFEDIHLILEAKRDSHRNAYQWHIGQLADYALALRECQPTRTFVPLLFLHGRYLDLLVFTNRGYFRTPLGPVLYRASDDRRDNPLRQAVGKSLCRLWFFLTLPANRFGFLLGTPGVPRRLRFSADVVPATAEDAGRASGDDIVHVGELLNFSVWITGQCTYLYMATFRDKAAILKLSSTQTNRLPEGAVYRVLENYKRPPANDDDPTDSGDQGVPNLPKIFLSGNLVEDFDGFRLEFLVMEHCGTPIVSHFQSVLSDKDSRPNANAQAKLYVRQVTSTLTTALAAGVLHRDISAGNIAVKDGKAFVIDWGYAKLVKSFPDDDFTKEVAKRWSFDWEAVNRMETTKDPFTETPLYMSARLHLGSTKRGIYDDLESLLYVMLDAFSSRERASRGKKSSSKKIAQPPGFVFYSGEVAALTRLSCTQSSRCFLGKFGVSADPQSAPCTMLDAMRRFLFFSDGIHLGDRIQENDDFPRTFDDSAAKAFMSKETVLAILPLVCDDGRQVPQSPLPLIKEGDASPVRIGSNELKSTSAARPLSSGAPAYAEEGDLPPTPSSTGRAKLPAFRLRKPANPLPLSKEATRAGALEESLLRRVLRSGKALDNPAKENAEPAGNSSTKRGSPSAGGSKRAANAQSGRTLQQPGKRARK